MDNVAQISAGNSFSMAPYSNGINKRSEAQLHEGDRVWGGSVERSCEPMEKNRIEGGADQGERARNREALVIKGQAA